MAEPVAVAEPAPEAVLVPAPEAVLVPAPEAVVVAKAKRTLSPEHLAKLKAGRELKKLLQLAAAEMEKDLPPAPVAQPEVAPEPVTEAKPTEAKPKRTLSPEHLAKLKAGREAAKAKKLASTEVTVTVTSPEVPRPSIEIPQESIMPEEPVPVAVAEPVEKKRRGPKKLSDMTPEELAAHKLKVEERKAAKVTFKEPVVEPVQIKFKTA